MTAPDRPATTRVRHALEGVDAFLVALRETMTPGQRWTATLAMCLTVLVVLFGLPRHVVVVPGTEEAAAVGSGRSRGGSSAPITGVPGGISVPDAPVPPSLQEVLAAAVPPSTGAAGTPPVGPVAAPVFVALVRSGDRPEPGHDDAAIAKVFLARGGVTAASVPLGGAPADVCRATISAGNTVLTATTLDPALRDCLLQAGVVIFGHDGNGDRPPISPGGAQLISTRRGSIDSLLDLARWGARSDALHGRVGLVIDSTAADTTAAAVDGFRAAGVDVVATAVVSNDPSSPSIGDGVRAFSSKAVDVAVLALPVVVQDRWVAAAAVLAPGMRHVVSDAFDGIVNEMYPPTFDGSLAHTSLRVPWFAKAHGQTPEQRSCLQAWEATATPSTTLSADEQIDVFAWCETVSLSARALSAPMAFANAVRETTAASPLTSTLGPLGDGRWGPTQDAALVWRASCVCWQEQEQFTDRSSP